LRASHRVVVDNAVKKILEELQGFSWTTEYISFNEQMAGKQPTLYREIKIEERRWQALKKLTED